MPQEDSFHNNQNTVNYSITSNATAYLKAKQMCNSTVLRHSHTERGLQKARETAKHKQETNARRHVPNLTCEIQTFRPPSTTH